MTQRTFYPGDKWVYFKIYIPPTLANQILIERIYPLVNEWIEEKVISKWFYIRYSDTGYHIRLRTELIELSYMGKVVTELRKQLSEELGNGTVSRIQLDTYQRELERYGVDLIERCEYFFYEDSQKVLSTISEKLKEEDLLCASIKWVMCLLLRSGLDVDQMKQYLSEMEMECQREFNLSQQQIKAMNDYYRVLRSRILENVKEIISTSDDCESTYTWIQNAKKSRSLLSSLIHMHMNRLFATSQRLYEYIVYHIAYKGLDSVVKMIHNGNSRKTIF